MLHKPPFLSRLSIWLVRRRLLPRFSSEEARNYEPGAATGKISGEVHENAEWRRALQHAGKELGLSKQALAQAVDEAPSFFDPGQGTSPIAPRTYQRIGLMLRLHDSLSSLVENDVGHMRGCMGALNWPTGGIPAKQLKDPDQLEKLVSYLEAFQ